MVSSAILVTESPHHCNCHFIVILSSAIRVTETPITVIAISLSLFLCHLLLKAPSLWLPFHRHCFCAIRVVEAPITVTAISSSLFLVPSWLLKALVIVTAISSSLFLCHPRYWKPPSVWLPFHRHCFCAIRTTESPHQCERHFIVIVFVPSALLKASITVIAISSSLFLCHLHYWKPPSVWSPFHRHCFCAIRVTKSPHHSDRHFIVIVFVPSALLKAPITVIAISSSLFVTTLYHPFLLSPLVFREPTADYQTLNSNN